MSRPRRKKLRTSPAPSHPTGHLLAEFEPLLPAEEKLRKACRHGEVAKITGERPEAMTDTNHIRPAVLRVFCLGLDPATPVHEHGVQIQGAWIDGDLDLFGCVVPRPLGVFRSVFQGELQFSNARTAALAFTATECNGVWGDGMICEGDIYLRNNFISHGPIRLTGARISGDLNCSSGHFKGNPSIILENAKIFDTLYLDRNFYAEGVIDLIDLDTDCLVDNSLTWKTGNWELDGFVYRRFAGDAPVDAAARIRWLDCQGHSYLNHDFRPQPWEQCAKVLADMGHEADAIEMRIEKRVRMRPLPLHRARTGKKKRHLRAAVVHLWRKPNIQRLSIYSALLSAYLRALTRQAWVRLGMFFDFLLCLTVGYGFRPKRAVAGLLLCWLVAAMVYAYAVPKGVMAPTDALVYMSPKIPAECRRDWLGFDPAPRADDLDRRVTLMPEVGLTSAAVHGPNHPSQWNEVCPRLMPSEYTTFSPWLYALDVLLPIVDLRQESDWSPRVFDETGTVIAPWSENSSWGWGHSVRIFEWVLILVGWSLSALLVGAVTGIIRRD